jgi:uncharacterized membrane protein YpjA
MSSRSYIEIDGVIFVLFFLFFCQLVVASHWALVDEGLEYFESMGSVYSVSTTMEY